MSKCLKIKTALSQVEFYSLTTHLLDKSHGVISSWCIHLHFLALPSLLQALNQCRTSVPATDEAFNFLSEVLKSRELNALVNVHGQISNRVKDEFFHPILSNGLQIAVEVLDLLATRKNLSPDFEEICSLLKNPHLQVLTTVQI